MSNSENAELIAEFVAESRENLDQLDTDLVELEKSPKSEEILTRIFRTFHTIKGTCGFLGFSKLESLTHAAESLLSRLRDGKLAFNAPTASALLAVVDGVRRILAQIEETEAEGEGDYSSLTETLVQLQQGGPARSEPRSEPICEEALPAREDALPAARAAENNVRVDVRLLDKQMNLVGELVLARNRLLQVVSEHQSTELALTCDRLSRITSELQESVMKTRMQPIGNVFAKIPRLVRDVALACGKKVRIEIEGSDTELDRTIIEAIRDPITHAVRNAIDHGIEDPMTRVERQKAAEGLLSLRAFYEGGQVNIEISDDGAGIDADAVREGAVKRRLVTAEQAGAMSDREALHLICLPGFSTKESVTHISGRGVGMDVVKTNIERIGGTVDLQSRPGAGTTIRIKIPLTLAIIPVLIVRSGGERFAVPQVSLRELVRLNPERAASEIHEIRGARVLRLRQTLLPLVDLGRQLDLPADSRESAGQRPVNVVVVHAGDQELGIIVDEIDDAEEIVVKPNGRHVKDLSVFAGATILGDGKVVLILDVLGLARRAQVVSESRPSKLTDSLLSLNRAALENESYLLFSLGEKRRMAVELERVIRLEEIAASSIEWAGNKEVVQHRGRILPLVFPSRMLEPARPRRDPEGFMTVIVCRDMNRTVGLVVDRILDIVEEKIAPPEEADRHPYFTKVVLQQRVAELLDLSSLLEAAERADSPTMWIGPKEEARATP